MRRDRPLLGPCAAFLVFAAAGVDLGPGHTVSAVVFYDENENGRLEADETVRLPGVRIEVAGKTALSADRTGRAGVEGVPEGAHDATLDTATLPPFFVAPPAVPVSVPTAGDVILPVTLPIGANRPNTYMAFGDSITEGEGSSDETGYLSRLQARLQEHFGAATVLGEGASGTISHQGA